jgi:hypothetical protein
MSSQCSSFPTEGGRSAAGGLDIIGGKATASARPSFTESNCRTEVSYNREGFVAAAGQRNANVLFGRLQAGDLHGVVGHHPSAHKRCFRSSEAEFDRGRSSVGRAPALQVDKPKRCATMCFRRWRTSAVAGIMR